MEKAESEKSNTFQTVIQPILSEDPFRVIYWLQQNRLLKSNVICDGCDTLMNWSKYSKAKDGFAWKCLKKDCGRYKSTTSIRTGSFSARSNMSLQNWVHVMYLWSQQTGEATVAQQVPITEKMVVSCYSFFREVCSTYFLAKPVRLGGPGITVDIGVTCFADTSKKPQGSVPYATTRVLAVVDSKSPATGYMEVVPKTGPATFLPVLQKVVKPGSIIHSEEWRVYRDIQGLEYTDIMLDHSLNFVDLPKGEHSQTISSYWERHRSHIKALPSSKQEFLNSYLQEYMWRDLFRENTFKALCQHIAAQYPM